MTESTNIILGFDPSGRGNFGWSVCREVAEPPHMVRVDTGLANDACDALDRVKAALPANSKVLAAGIDAPLMWSQRGNRQIDAIIRNALRGNPNAPRVLAVNRLWGSVTVQGALLAKSLWETWGSPITESHPQALLCLLEHPQQAAILAMANGLISGLIDHQLDATLSAVAAWAMLHHERLPKWRNLYEPEPRLVQPFNTSVRYWMPIPPGD